MAYARSKYAPFAENLPNIRQFDYTECLVAADGKTLTLAPLGDTHRYNELSALLQGVQAFRVLGDGPAMFQNPDHSADQETEATTSVKNVSFRIFITLSFCCFSCVAGKL